MQIQHLLPLDNKSIDDAFTLLRILLTKKNTDELQKTIEIYEERIKKTHEMFQQKLLTISSELMESLDELLKLIRFLNIHERISSTVSICSTLARAYQSYLLTLDMREQTLPITLEENGQLLVICFSVQEPKNLFTNNLTRLSIPYSEGSSGSGTNPTQQYRIYIHQKDIENILFIFFKSEYKNAHNQIRLEELVGDEATNEYYDRLTAGSASVDPAIFNQPLDSSATPNPYGDFFPSRDPVFDLDAGPFTNNKPVSPTSKVSSNSSSFTEEQKQLLGDIWNRKGGVPQNELIERLSNLKL